MQYTALLAPDGEYNVYVKFTVNTNFFIINNLLQLHFFVFLF
jgi:hypothetical protein